MDGRALYGKVIGAMVSAVFLAVVPPAGAQDVMAIKAGRLIDGTGSPPIENAVLLVRGERIEAVGKASQVMIPPGARIIDLSAETVLPGLINGHDHPTVRAFTGPDVQRQGRNSLIQQLDQMAEPQALQVIRGVRDLRADLLAGVTSEYVVGEVEYNDTYLKRMCDLGVVPCPRMFLSGSWILPTSGFQPIPETNGPWAMRDTVRKNVQNGAHHIKIVVTRSMATGPSAGHPYRPSDTNFTKEEVQAVVDEAHRLGVKVTAHATDSTSIQFALEAGADSIQHALGLTPDIVKLFVERHAGFVNTYAAILQSNFTLTDFHFLDTQANSAEEWVTHARHLLDQAIARNPSMGGFSQLNMQQWLEERCSELRMARDAGIPIAVGTDNMQGLLDIDVEHLVHCGFTPLEAIRSATGDGAKVLGIDSEVGTLQQGKYADLISVKGSPDKNIEDLSKVDLVMVGGKVYRQMSYR
jgi:imidazolonepropionase-like amidohydrolase